LNVTPKNVPDAWAFIQIFILDFAEGAIERR